MFCCRKVEHLCKHGVFFPQLVNISDNYMTLMGDNGDIREDLRVPDNDIGREIESKFEAGDDFLVSRVFTVLSI